MDVPPQPPLPEPPAHKSLKWEKAAVFALFALDGVAFGTWAAYLPVYKSRLGITDAQLGPVLLALVVGSLFSMPGTGWLLRRNSSRRVVLFGSVACSLTIPLVTLAAMSLGSLPAFVAAGLLFGAAKGIIDVSANAHAIAVERDGDSPLLSTCHGGWSLGVLCGASAVALALRAGLSPLVGTSLVAAALIGLTAAAGRAIRVRDLSTPGVEGEAVHASVWPRGRLIPIAALAFLGLFCEGSIGDWATIFLADETHASDSAAALGFATYSFVMMCSRFAGDRSVKLLGPSALLAASGLSLALGLGLAIAVRTYPVAVFGLALVGIGTSNIVPILFRAAGRGGDSGAAIASVSTVGYLGFLVGPPLIAALSRSTGLPAALSVVVLCALAVAACSRLVGERPVVQNLASNSQDERITNAQPDPCL